MFLHLFISFFLSLNNTDTHTRNQTHIHTHSSHLPNTHKYTHSFTHALPPPTSKTCTHTHTHTSSSHTQSRAAHFFLRLVQKKKLSLCQFHQHFMQSFYMQRSQKRKRQTSHQSLLRFWDLRAQKMQVNMLVKLTPSRIRHVRPSAAACCLPSSSLSTSPSSPPRPGRRWRSGATLSLLKKKFTSNAKPLTRYVEHLSSQPSARTKGAFEASNASAKSLISKIREK